MKNSDQEQFDELWKKALEESYRIEVPDPSASWAKVSLQLEKERRRRLGKRRVAMVAVTAASLLIGGTVFSVPVETNAYNPITKMLNNLKGDLVTFFNGVDEKNTSGAKTDSPPAEFEGQQGGEKEQKDKRPVDPVNGMLSLSEAEKGLSFPLAKPAYLPDGYSFAFAIPYESNGTTFEGVNLIYKSGDKPILQITERTLATFNQFSQKFTDHVTDIEINGNPGKLMITRESRVQVLLKKPSSFIYIMSELPKEEVVRILESAK